MSIVVSGKSLCVVCGRVLEEADKIASFPAFLPPTHRLARFSDAACHLECFNRAPESEAVARLFRLYRDIWESRPKNLKSLDEMNAWGKSAFKDFPPDEQ